MVILPSCPLNFVQKMSLLMRAGKEIGMTSLPMLFQAAAKIEMPSRSSADSLVPLPIQRK